VPLRGTFRVFQYGVLVGQILAHVDFLDAPLADLDAQITARVAPYEPIIERLQMIPGAASSACDRLDLADLPRVFCGAGVGAAAARVDLHRHCPVEVADRQA
jgi:hypothetical protein